MIDDPDTPKSKGMRKECWILSLLATPACILSTLCYPIPTFVSLCSYLAHSYIVYFLLICLVYMDSALSFLPSYLLTSLLLFCGASWLLSCVPSSLLTSLLLFCVASWLLSCVPSGLLASLLLFCVRLLATLMRTVFHQACDVTDDLKCTQSPESKCWRVVYMNFKVIKFGSKMRLPYEFAGGRI